MHYFIDGYNLLFKEAWARTAPTLEEARKKLIVELDTLASIVHLNITVVFDAPFQSDDIKRGHFQSLEIIFTARGQTADDYLIDCADSNGKNAVIVTSDRSLAYKVKASGSKVESVHDFLVHLRKKSRNKLAKSKSLPSLKKPHVQIVQKKEEDLTEKPLDMKNLPSLADIPAWEKIFTKKGPKGPR